MLLASTLPLVSIIIPVFNRNKYLLEAIESALNQTYSNIEVLLVDDGSNFDVVEFISDFRDKVRVIKTPHRGACAARNTGLKESKGEFIQFLDSDDILMPNKIEKQLPPLLNDQADIVFSDNDIFGHQQTPEPEVRPVLNSTDALPYTFQVRISTHVPLHRRSCLLKVGGFRESLPKFQDCDLHCRLAAAGFRFYQLHLLLSRQRLHAGPRLGLEKFSPTLYLRLVLTLVKEFMHNNYLHSAARCQCLADVLLVQSEKCAKRHRFIVALRGWLQALRMQARAQILR